MPSRSSIAIVNRSFWPASQVIGEALLQVAERLALQQSVSVITQSPCNLHEALELNGRGAGVRFCVCKSRSDSATHLLWRAFDAMHFMMWVFAMLCLQRPRTVYVSTDPPVVVPLVVSIYALLFRARVIYHLQDIHPEAANIIIPLHPFVFRLLRAIDAWSMRRAAHLITLSDDMAQVIRQRAATTASIQLLDNPALAPAPIGGERHAGLIYCGNAGRLQRIPLLIEAIRLYRSQGGILPFEFVGGGVHANGIQELARSVSGVSYLGQTSAATASARVAAYDWAILSIDDEVTRYAFPSKSSTYAMAGSHILAVCDEDTSVARWVEERGLGMVSEPVVASVVSAFFAIEHQQVGQSVGKADTYKLSMPHFVSALTQVLQVT